MVGLQVYTFGSIPLIPVTPFLAYESLPGFGSDPGPQRSIEGWVVFVAGIYEETQVKTDVSPSARVVARDITQHRTFMVVEFAVASSFRLRLDDADPATAPTTSMLLVGTRRNDGYLFSLPRE